MTKMFSMIFVILFLFIMVLCAIQPIAFAHAVETGDSLTLSVKLIELSSRKIYLMLDEDTPLTPRYIMDNPEYKVYISCSGNFGASVDIAVGNSYGTAGVWRGADSNTLYEFSYANSTIDTYANKYNDYLDSPIYVSCGHDKPTFAVYASKNYELTLLEKLYLVAVRVFDISRNAINFILDNPVILLSVAISLITVAVVIAKRFIVR